MTQSDLRSAVETASVPDVGDEGVSHYRPNPGDALQAFHVLVLLRLRLYPVTQFPEPFLVQLKVLWPAWEALALGLAGAVLDLGFSYFAI